MQCIWVIGLMVPILDNEIKVGHDNNPYKKKRRTYIFNIYNMFIRVFYLFQLLCVPVLFGGL